MLAANSTPHAIDIVLNALHTDATQLRHCWQSLQAHTAGYVQVVILTALPRTQTPLLKSPAGWRVHWLYAPEMKKVFSQALAPLQQAWLVHLQADYLVTPNWLSDLLACAEQHPRIAFVGGWSNRLGAQSLNEPEHPQLPLDFMPAQMAYRMRRSDVQLHPSLPVLQPDCLLIRRRVLEDYLADKRFVESPATAQQHLLACQQHAQQAGWQTRLANNVYVYRNTAEAAPLSIAAAEVQQQCADNRSLQAIRLHHQNLMKRWHKVELGQYYWHERRVLIILPLRESSGGAHVLVSEAHIMRRMKIDVQFLNFHQHRAGWETHYPDLDIPVLYVNGPEDVAAACAGFDAVIATAYFTVDWLLPLKDQPHAPRLGYYVQDFEPYFFIEKTTAKFPFFWHSRFLRRRIAGYYFRRHAEFRRAWLSYLQFPQMHIFTKTAWNQRELKTQVGRDSIVIGPSYQIEQFLPRPEPKHLPSPEPVEERPIRIVAMIRPVTARRSPLLTMRVLRRIQQQYGGRVDICIFGANRDDPAFLALPRDFVFRQHGMLLSEHVADVLSWSDIFVDFSQFQAMGLTGLEAMACGAAVILPQTGGADSFARHEQNALLVNTHSESACVQALQRLIAEPALRRRLIQQAQQDVVQYAPEYTTFRLLSSLWGY